MKWFIELELGAMWLGFRFGADYPYRFVRFGIPFIHVCFYWLYMPYIEDTDAP